MNTNSFRKLFGLAALASVVAGAQGCVADRPSRNAVFDENQYIRKDFLIQNAANGAPDPGWFMKATVVQTSTPNPLAPRPASSPAPRTRRAQQPRLARAIRGHVRQAPAARSA